MIAKSTVRPNKFHWLMNWKLVSCLFVSVIVRIVYSKRPTAMNILRPAKPLLVKQGAAFKWSHLSSADSFYQIKSFKFLKKRTQQFLSLYFFLSWPLM